LETSTTYLNFAMRTCCRCAGCRIECIKADTACRFRDFRRHLYWLL